MARGIGLRGRARQHALLPALKVPQRPDHPAPPRERSLLAAPALVRALLEAGGPVPRPAAMALHHPPRRRLLRPHALDQARSAPRAARRPVLRRDAAQRGPEPHPRLHPEVPAPPSSDHPPPHTGGQGVQRSGGRAGGRGTCVGGVRHGGGDGVFSEGRALIVQSCDSLPLCHGRAGERWDCPYATAPVRLHASAPVPAYPARSMCAIRT